MGQFGKMVASATPNEGAGFWMKGQYLVQIDVCKVIENRKNDLCFIVSGQALKSTHEECPVGCTRDWVCNLKHDSSSGNVKSFIMAATGIPQDQIEEDGVEAVVDDKNPLHGELVWLEVSIVQTKLGNDFSKHVWKPVNDAVKKDIVRLRDEAGLPPF